MKYFFLFLIAASVCSCKQTSNQKQSQLVVVDVAKDYPAKEIWLQDIADVEYIPLATSDSALANFDTPVVSDDGIAIRGSGVGEILLFDRQGQALQGRICRRGQGPEEYTTIVRYIVDWKRKEVFIVDYQHLKVYDFEGNYRRTLLADCDMMMLDIDNLNPDYLLCSYNKTGAEEPYRPYFTLSKENGTTDTLAIEIPRFIASNRKVIMENGNSHKAHGYLPNLGKCTDRTYLTNVALDTVFALMPDRSLVAVMAPLHAPTRDPEAPLLYFRGMNDYYTWTSRLPRQVTVYMSDITAGREKREKLYMHNRRTGEWFEPIYRNRAIDNREIDPVFINTANVPYGYGLVMLGAADLAEAYANHQITDEKLKAIASNLKEEDNPVLMILKFKN